jgi:EAL domain-containing protein (putative c-di-GMP-specific phosphodiesterase class I)/GGDEF domain-containing protein
MKEKNTEQRTRFYELFTQLVSAMTDFNAINVPLIESLLVELCVLLRLSKAETFLYNSLEEEKLGKGERLCSYDTGEGEPVVTFRIETSIMTVGKMIAYMKPGDPPLSDDERNMVELAMRTTLSFVSRNRYRNVVEMLAFYDDAGYRNLRSLRNHYLTMFNAKQLNNLAVIRYNLRRFSLINRNLGRKSADVAMRNHYELIEGKAGKDGIVCRLDADNFVAVCKKEYLDELLACLEAANVVYDEQEGKTVEISANAGVFVIPDNFVYAGYDDIWNRLIHSYMEAMSGKQGQIVFYDEKVERNRFKIVQVQHAFHEALRREEFFAVYQPKYNIKTGKITGAEALCRWRHKGKLVLPGDFIPALEETNDICSLDFYMLDRVCRDIRRWLDEGRKVVRISVNLSRKHMLNSNLLKDVKNVIDKYKIPHRYLEFECTETTTDVEFGVLQRIVKGMKRMGISTAVDDYGIGYSSLNLLRSIPWNVVKIDRSILPLHADDSNNRQLNVVLKHVLAMLREIGLECVVEGVETQYQVDLLREMNCDVAQGFFFDRPLLVEEFEKRMENNT